MLQFNQLNNKVINVHLSKSEINQELLESKSIAEQIEANGNKVSHDKKCQFHKRPQCSGYVLTINDGEAFACSDCGEIELG